MTYQTLAGKHSSDLVVPSPSENLTSVMSQNISMTHLNSLENVNTNSHRKNTDLLKDLARTFLLIISQRSVDRQIKKKSEH